MDWFRTWHGAATDSKFLAVAARAKARPGVVAAVFWALLDYASQAADRGSVKGFDPESYAAWSGFEQAEVEATIRAMTDKGVIRDDRLSSWEKRQPKREDNSGSRVRALRERQADADTVTRCNADADTVTRCNAAKHNVTIEESRVEEIREDEIIGEETRNAERTDADASGAQRRKPAKPKPERDVAKDHPAVQTYRRITKLWPAGDWSKRIAETVTDLPLWETLLDEWVNGHGWNKRDVVKLLRAYKEGGIRDFKPSGNGRGKQTFDEKMAEVDRLIDKKWYGIDPPVTMDGECVDAADWKVNDGK